MKITSTLIAVLVLALTGIGSRVEAEEATPANYLALKGGIYTPSGSFELNHFNAGGRTRVDGKTGFDAELAIGHYFLPMLAVELGTGYFESRGAPYMQPGEVKVKVVPVLATGKFLFPLGSFEPYLEGGFGAYTVQVNVSGNTDSFRGASKVTYGLHAGAGVNVKVSHRVFMGFEGRYLTTRPSFGGHQFKPNGFTATANLGWRF